MLPSLLRNLIVIFLDLIFASLALLFSLWAVDPLFARILESLLFFEAKGLILYGVYILSCLFSYLVFRTYQSSWRYTALRDLLSLSYASFYTNAALLLSILVLNRLDVFTEHLRITTILVNVFICQAALAFPRVIYRYLNRERIIHKEHQSAILFGSLSSVDLFLRYNKGRDIPYKPKFIVTIHESEKSLAQKIHGIRVLPLEKFLQKHEKFNLEEGMHFVITDPKCVGAPLDQIFEAVKYHKVEILRVADLHPSKGQHNQLRPIDIEDLLGRPKIELSLERPEKLIHGKTILITGAGGSIGSEIVHQVMHLGPKQVIIVDQCEYFLYEIDQSLRAKRMENQWQAKVADVTNSEEMDDIFATFKPDVVFHAAAMKHVPLSEINLRAVFDNNVMGTWTLASLCSKYKTQSMILISTDKAVNPSNAMGLTKRLAEIICQTYDLANSSTRYAAVRFGNVLGSRGSVIPLFQQQIAKGGPVTVTDKNMERYFMTIEEAVSLVLQAGALGTLEDAYRGGIFVLDMGKPVNVLKMAERLIELSGFQPYADIPITFTGIRSGEKLGEELFYVYENLRQNVIEGVHFIQAAPKENGLTAKSLESELLTLRQLFKNPEKLLQKGYELSKSQDHLE